MRQPERLAAALVAGALLGACTYTPSKVGADADVDIGGTVLRQDGRPAAGARVSLRKRADAGEALTAVFSLGLACLSEELGDICRDARITTSGDDGRFEFHLKGADTHGSIGNAATMDLAAALPRRANEYEGPATSTSFLVQQAKMNLSLHAWEPSVKATAQGRVVRMEWTDPPARLIPEVDPSRLGSLIRFERRGALVWEFRDLDPGAEIDPRLLEDTSGSFSVALEGTGFKVTEAAGTEIGVTLRSARFPYRSPASKPVSRGAACSVLAAKRRVPQPSCSLTDGNFIETFKPLTAATCPTGGCPVAADAVVDLGGARPVSLVAVRGCPDGCSAAVSTDGKTWQAIGSYQDPNIAADRSNAAFTLNRPIQARYVRVQGDEMSQLREVSVWDRYAPAPAAPTSFVAPVDPSALPRLERARSSRLPLIAAILGGLVLGALGMAFVRRRRPAA